MAARLPWAGQAPRAAAAALAAVLLAGCLELDMQEAVEADGSILSGEVSYSLVIPEDLDEIDPDGATGLGECLLPSAGDPLPPGAGREARDLAELADRLALERTHASRVGQTVRCAWRFRVDLAEWVPDPESPLFAQVEYTEAPRRGWWVYQVPADEALGDDLPEEVLDELLGGVRMTSTVSGEGVIAEGYVRQADGSWRWSGTAAEILQARPRYWIPG